MNSRESDEMAYYGLNGQLYGVCVEPYLHGGGKLDGENILAPPASDWSVVRTYLCFLRLIGYGVRVEPYGEPTSGSRR